MDAEITCECTQPSNKQTNSNNEVLFADAKLKTRVFLQENKENNSKDSSRRIEYGFKDCKDKGINNRCNHCFICGKTEHKVYDCPEKVSNKNR